MATGKQKPGEYEAKLRIKKGDTVMVIAGKDKGKTGKIMRAFPKTNKVLVEGVNIMVKHQKPRQTGRQGAMGAQNVDQGGRIEMPAPLFVPKVMLVCPNCGKPTRVQYAFREGDGKLASRKYRVCHHEDCGKAID
jgi:large subunit ribosomal protein L24